MRLPTTPIRSYVTLSSSHPYISAMESTTIYALSLVATPGIDGRLSMATETFWISNI